MKKKITRSKVKVSKRIKSKSTPISPLPLILVLALIIISGYYVYRSLLSSSGTPIQIAEVKNATGSVNLNLNSTKTSLSPNQDATVTLTYDSPTDKLTVISGEISYDPAVLTVSNFVKGEGFPTEFAAASAANGKITFTYGVAVAAGSGLTGQGNILSFKVKSKAVGASTLAITDATQVLVTGNSNNALREITNTTVAVSDPAASPSTAASAAVTPSPSAKASVSPSPVVSPSAAASVIPSTPASPIASVPVVQKPAAPSNLVYNCYSDGKRITLRWSAVANVDSYEVFFDQKDGDNDQTKSATRAEIDLDIKNNTNYKWSVVSIKDGVKSDVSSVNDIKCSGDVAQAATPTPTATPTVAPTPTPAPTKTPITQQIAGIFKPKSPSPTPTPKPTLTPTDYTAPNQNSNVIATPTATPGSLSDIFASPTATPVAATNNTNFFSKILLGWQALFIRFVESISR